MLDAVEAATKVLEDDTHFNAGRGSVLNRAGEVEMDALIMEGCTLRLGAVTGVRKTRHPISLARAVLESSPHVFLSGSTTDAFAALKGLELVEPAYFITSARKEQLERALATLKIQSTPDPSLPSAPATTVNQINSDPPEADVDAGDHDTVGAVAIDADGNLACATSTGGLCAKWVGRVGDTPVVGAGGFADSRSGAVSTTGTGEHIMRFMLARSVAAAWERLSASAAACGSDGGSNLARRAVEETLADMAQRFEDPGEGVIFIDKNGGIGLGHTSPRMSWGLAEATFPTEQGGAPVLACAGGVQLGLSDRSGCGSVHSVVPNPETVASL